MKRREIVAGMLLWVALVAAMVAVAVTTGFSFTREVWLLLILGGGYTVGVVIYMLWTSRRRNL